MVKKRSIIYLALVLGLILPLGHSAERQPLQPFSLSSHDNTEINLNDYVGSVVLVNFWASWCGPCVHEFPSIQGLKAHFKSQSFEVLAVNMGESSSSIHLFLDSLDTPINFPVLIDESMSAAIAWGVRGLPTTILLDKQGQEIYRFVGPKDWNSEEVQTQVAEYMQETVDA